jgi:hypothetical protein
VQDLIESETFEERQTPLHYASKKGSLAAVDSLIKDYDANKEAKDHLGKEKMAKFIGNFSKFFYNEFAVFLYRF